MGTKLHHWIGAPLGMLLLLSSCQKDGEKAQRIVNETLRTHGVKLLETDTVNFTFRDHRYLHHRKNGRFHYERWPIDSAEAYRDVLTNEGFTRYRDGRKVELPAKDSSAYAQSLNSVIYFAFLPYRLNDPPVKKSYRGTDSIEGTLYHRVRITFRQKGGGEDHEDIFLYWFRKKDGRMDFLAYRYFREGGGVRFREAYDRRELEGMIVQNYRNYKAPKDVELKDLDEMWQKGELERVSLIRTENVELK
jgi:hypothetical protein